MSSHNSFNSQRTLTVNNINYEYFSLAEAEKSLPNISLLPFSLKILLENLLRNEDNLTVSKEDIQAIANWAKEKTSEREIAYRPARLLMQDFTGVPAVADLAAMREAIKKMGGDPEKINPLSSVDLVIDHSVQVDFFNSNVAFEKNVHLEMERNRERYEFLRWGQTAFQNFRVVPPGTGICHQVNLEFLAKTVWTHQLGDKTIAYPDTLVGTDSHTTMINGLGVLGWGVGGIEAEAAMLGQPISMLIPEVIGVKLSGKLHEGVTATDLVLTITEMLRKKGVVGKFVEYYGPGLKDLSLPDRATIANMAPEYGATCGFFPIDQATIDYLHLTNRDKQTIDLVKAYAKAQGLWHDLDTKDPTFTETLLLDLASVEPSLAGPKRPQDRVSLSEIAKAIPPESHSSKLKNGDVVIAAITSCTNTSNPSVLMAAGLVAKKALQKGLTRKPWVKSSLAPGSQVVTRYLKEAGLQTYLDELGFSLVGYGCTTCIGNSGPLSDEISNDITQHELTVSSVLSGNRNFEGRVHPLVKANWLASPPLVVAFALAGTTQIDLTKESLGRSNQGEAVYLKDIWPSNEEVHQEVAKISKQFFKEQYSDVFTGTKEWQAIAIPQGKTYTWTKSTYIQLPPFFDSIDSNLPEIKDIKNARVLALLGDSVTTDHISPAGSIKKDSPAGQYLLSQGVAPEDFNSLGARRGNHEVMMRGTFANVRIRNEMVPGVEGGFTKYIPTGETLSIFEASQRYLSTGVPLIVIAGKEYGTGSSRDWAAKGPKLLGVTAVIAESFERIHRSNLVGMGILPLQFKEEMNRKTLSLTGDEEIDLIGITKNIKPKLTIKAVIKAKDGTKKEIELIARIDTLNEIEYYKNGGILQYVLRKMAKNQVS